MNVADLTRRVWAMDPTALEAFLEAARTAEPGVQLQTDRRSVPAAGGVAVLPLRGTLFQHENLWTAFGLGMSTTRYAQAFDAALQDPNVHSIVLDIDSPGGEEAGTAELAEKVYAARGQKRVVSAVNSYAASAAYWIASQASEIAVSPSAALGSIGVYMAHLDVSRALDAAGQKVTFVHAGRFKVEGNFYEPLGDEARSHLQTLVDECYDRFVRAVARGRSANLSAVRGESFGEGRVVGAARAISNNMANRVATLETVVEELGQKGSSRRRRSASLKLAHARRRPLGSIPAGSS